MFKSGLWPERERTSLVDELRVLKGIRMEDQEFPKGESMAAFEAEVRETAYFLWEQDGRPNGRSEEYWQKALDQKIRERNLDSELAKSPPPISGE